MTSEKAAVASQEVPLRAWYGSCEAISSTSSAAVSGARAVHCQQARGAGGHQRDYELFEPGDLGVHELGAA
jgi:hypothetical protein